MKPPHSPRRRRNLLWAALSFLVLFWGCTESAAEWVTVRRVNDGDTVELTDGRLVRYIGINTPEIDHALDVAEPFGFAARRKNRRTGERETSPPGIRPGAFRPLPAHPGLRVPGGRLDGKLRLDALRARLCLYRKPNVKYERLLLTAQREAMQARRGIWQGWSEKNTVLVGNRNSTAFPPGNLHRR